MGANLDNPQDLASYPLPSTCVPHMHAPCHHHTCACTHTHTHPTLADTILEQHCGQRLLRHGVPFLPLCSLASPLLCGLCAPASVYPTQPLHKQLPHWMRNVSISLASASQRLQTAADLLLNAPELRPSQISSVRVSSSC